MPEAFSNISINRASRIVPPEGDNAPGFYRFSNEWHSKNTRKTYNWVGRWVEVSDSRDFWDFCESHQRREPHPDPSGTPTHPPAYKSCRACFHVWLTEDEFLWDIEYRNERLRIPDSDDEIICPLCNEYF